MIRRKPFISISLFSLILAFSLIALGVKYHWGERLNALQLPNSNKPALELPIPQVEQPVEAPSQLTQTAPKPQSNVTQVINPQIIETHSPYSAVEAMTKSQVQAACEALLQTQFNDQQAFMLATANCVMSNYQAPIQENHLSTAEAQQQAANKAQAQRDCARELGLKQAMNHAIEINTQLLLGLCVSDKLNQ